MVVPMIQIPAWPSDVLTDQFSVVVDIYNFVPPDPPTDPRGNPLPPAKQYIVQDEPADLQPKGGNQRAMQSGTAYEATHVLYIRRQPQAIPTGTRVDVKDSAGGQILQTLQVVFVADWGPHLELDLKAV